VDKLDKAKIKKYWDLSSSAFDEMKILFDQGKYRGSVSRGYYAIFYAACAILLIKGQEFSSHQAVISSFGRDFVKTGEIDPGFHRIFIDAFEFRQEADYDIDKVVDESYGKVMTEFAHNFREMANEYLKN